MIRLLIVVFMGCSAFSAGSQNEDLNYVDHIAPVINLHCASCHHPGGIGPMPLTTYSEVSSYGNMIKYVVKNNYMPPWLPDPHYRTFSNQRILSEKEKEQIVNWVDSGMKEGTGEEIAKAETSLTAPSVFKFCLETPFEQYGVYMSQYQVFVVPTGFTEPTWVTNLNFLPDNPEIVRKCIISIDSSNKWEKLDQWDPRYGYYSFGGPGAVPQYEYWFEWTPGSKKSPTSNETRFIPPNSNFIVEVHYGPTGHPQMDQSCWVLDTLSINESPIIRTAPLINKTTQTKSIPFLRADEVTRVHGSVKIPFDIKLQSIAPRAQLICREWELYAILPDQSVTRLLKINDWHKPLAEKYYFEDNLLLPEGSVIHAMATYDNTENNFSNPASPPIDIAWGQGMFEEQFIVHFDYLIENPRESSTMPPVFTAVENSKSVVNLWVGHAGNYEIAIKRIRDKKQMLDLKVRLKPGMNEVSIDLNTVPPGNYMVQVYGPDSSLSDQDFLCILAGLHFFRR